MPSSCRAFITGVTGQDGSYLAERLVGEGADVHALILPGSELSHVPGDVVLHDGDLTDVAGTRALLLDLAPQEIYHLAAISSVARSWAEPDLVARVNGTAAAGLVESAHQLVRRGHETSLVQASSAEIFGEPDRSPQDESTPIRPVNPYGAAKAFAHLTVGAYRRLGLRASNLVLYNHESPRRPAAFVTRKITSTVAAIAAGRADRLTLGNLEARRDWGWAPDYVDAMVRAARADPGDFVIATGHGHRVRDFVAAAFAAAGVDDWEGYVETDPALVRPTDPTDLVGDATLAGDRLGWSPTVGFEELVARMVDAETFS